MTVNNSRMCGIIIFAFTITLSSFPAYAKYSGGTGESNDPYQIATAEDLMLLGDSPTDYDKHFILTADIDLDPNLPGRRVFDGALIGASGRGFSGVFDGDGHTISNGVVFGGLFSYVGRNSEIRNLSVRDVNVTGNDGVGGLVRFNEGSLIACCTSGSVSASGDRVGGLAGSNLLGSVTACFTTASVSGRYMVGGLIGDNTHGSLTSCYATGAVHGRSGVGGLVGRAGGIGNMVACYATGSVSGHELAGGLVGNSYFNYGGLIACVWDIETSGQSGSRGGKGLTTSQMNSLRVFQNAGWAEKGWVINDGQDYPRLAWEDTVGVPIPEPEPVPLQGSGTVEAPYQIWTASDFALLNWHSSILDKHIALMIDVNAAEVKLYPIGDLGTFTGLFEGNAHVIYNAVIRQPTSDRVGLFSHLSQTGQIRNLGAEHVTIAGRDGVGGLVGFDDHAPPSIWRHPNDGLVACHITGSIRGRSFVGGLVGYGQNSSLVACHATGSTSADGYDTGGLVGFNTFSNLTNCYCLADVNGIAGVGGLVGNNNSGSLAGCWAAGSTNGGTAVGGLVGVNGGDLSDCYSAGPVSGIGYVGGLIGQQGYTPFDTEDSVRTCYATGPVVGYGHVGGLVGSTLTDKISRCFWDVETSGQAASAGGTGKTTAEMQTAKTFLDAGWDFVGETANGTEDIWWILEGKDYPRLWWER